MPAKSKQQQQLFGLALSVKRGETPRSEVSDEVKKIVDSMSEKEIEDYAGTEHEGLPNKKEETMKERKEFDLRSFLTENKLTNTSKYLDEVSDEYKWLEKFVKMAKDSKDGNEFMKKARKDKSVPSETSKKFNDMYSGMSMRKAAEQFVKDAKSGKFDQLLFMSISRVGVKVRNGDFDKAFSVFKKKVRKSGILRKYKENQEFKKPSAIRQEKIRKREYHNKNQKKFRKFLFGYILICK